MIQVNLNHTPYKNNGITGKCQILILLFFLIIPAVETAAQSGGFSGAYTRMGFGPRGMAMGNAMGTVIQEGVYAHYNPALAAGVTGIQFDLSTALMSYDRNLNSVNATFLLPPAAGLNVGLLNANVFDIDGRTSSGYHTEYLSTHEYQLFAAFGINASSRISLGASAKLHLADFYADVSNATGAGFDLGLIVRPIDDWRIGLALQDIISKYSWNTTSIYGIQSGRTKSDPFPTRFRLSTSYLISGWDLLLSSEYEVLRQISEYQRLNVVSGSIPPQHGTITDNVTTNSKQFRIGAAWATHERFTLRGGWEVMDLDFIGDTGKFSAGFSIHLPYDALQPSVDYAFVREPLGIGGIHVLALRFNL